MRSTFKGFALALSMLSTLPFFRVHDFNKDINGYAVMFYPLVGFLLGLILWGVYVLLNSYVPTTHLGIIIFALWVLLTGALHLDGFSDTVDGLFVSREKALEVMKDSHIGGMGMIFTATFLILKASTLAVSNALYLLPFVLATSRLNAVLAIYLFPYVSPSGIGTLAKKETKGFQVLIAFVYVILIGMWSVANMPNIVTLMFASLFVLFVIKLFFTKRYGGFTGDIYGFTIEVSELVLLNAILVLGI